MMKNIAFVYFVILGLSAMVSAQEGEEILYEIPEEINNSIQANSINISGTRFAYPNTFEWKPDQSFYQLRAIHQDSMFLDVNEAITHAYPNRYERDVQNWQKVKFADPKYFSKKIKFQEMDGLLNYYPSSSRKNFDAMTVAFGNDSIMADYTISFPSYNEELQYKALELIKQMIWNPLADLQIEDHFDYTIDLSRSEFTQIMPSNRNIYYYLYDQNQPDLNPHADFILITVIKNKKLTDVKDDYVKRYPEKFYFNVEVLGEEFKKIKKKNAIYTEVFGSVDGEYFKDFFTFIEHENKVLVYKARLFSNDKKLIKQVKELPEKISFTESLP